MVNGRETLDELHAVTVEVFRQRCAEWSRQPGAVPLFQELGPMLSAGFRAWCGIQRRSPRDFRLRPRVSLDSRRCALQRTVDTVHKKSLWIC